MSTTYTIEVTRNGVPDTIDMKLKIPENPAEEVHGERFAEANIEWLHASERQRAAFLLHVEKQRDPSVQFVRLVAHNSDGTAVYETTTLEDVQLPVVEVASDSERDSELAAADAEA